MEEGQAEVGKVCTHRISPETFRYPPIKSMLEIAMVESDAVFSGSNRRGGIEGQP